MLRPGGRLLVHDGDYARTTVAVRDGDPLQRCAGAAVRTLVHDPWPVRRLPILVGEGTLLPATGEALKAEARQRFAAGAGRRRPG